MKLTLKAAAVAAAIASTVVLAAPGTASADPKDGFVAGKIYLFDGHNNTGDVLQLEPADILNIGWAWNDRASSVWNLSNDQVCIWTDIDHRGYYFSIPAGAKQELLFLYDNAVSSISVSGCGG
ncbi:peptidase inhibitor family I36 protein [Streptomyces fragilis]|uniref:Peptidase inhibitor family I36 protein n=1 Tax=Streptomyces fragilis TaxID=67301 RepID=A0ABV2YDX1_9ACTN|nr:peptidase inhibitor family I36 protein [Streptomyces fragilis]